MVRVQEGDIVMNRVIKEEDALETTVTDITNFIRKVIECLG